MKQKAANKPGQKPLSYDEFQLWLWTRDRWKSIKPLPLGLRLLATFILTTVIIETFLFISSSGYYLYNDRTIKVTSNSLGEKNVTTTTPSSVVQPDNYTVVLEKFTDFLQNFCNRKPVVMERTLPACPCISPLLKGVVPVETENIPTIGELELNLTDIQNGGYFRPSDCSPRHHVTIIVPFRDREEHLNIWLNHMHPFLQRQLLEYRIFVVEEVPHKVFNKAMMMNIGFIEARKLFNADCLIFHDVDMIPEDDRNLYACMEKPRHLGAFCDKWNYTLPYYGLFGGAISLTPAEFIRFNGYSNEFFGWGGEDDDMFQRVRASKTNITRFPQEVSKYTMLKHGRDKGNPYNSHAVKGFRARPKHYLKDGLNTLQYEVKSLEFRPLYTWIQADVTVPNYIQRQVRMQTNSGQVKIAATTGGTILCIIAAQLITFCHNSVILLDPR